MRTGEPNSTGRTAAVLACDIARLGKLRCNTLIHNTTNHFTVTRSLHEDAGPAELYTPHAI